MVESCRPGTGTEEDSSPMTVNQYEKIHGPFFYLELRSRLRIWTALLVLARLQKEPPTYFHQSVKRIMMDFRGTTTFGLSYRARNMEICFFVDSDLAVDLNDHKSMSGFLVEIGAAV